MTAARQLTRVYLSGPMFSAGDKWEQCALATTLEAAGSGIKCHVPQRDGIEVAPVMDLLNDHKLHRDKMLEPFVLDRCIVWVTRTVVALDVFQVVEGCQVAVLNIDGRVPDEGSLVEATLAWYAGHPVVPYKTTSISELDGNDNPMIGVISGWAHGLLDTRGGPHRREGSREVRRGRAAASDDAPARRPAAGRPRPSGFRHPRAASLQQDAAHSRREDSGQHSASVDGTARARPVTAADMPRGGARRHRVRQTRPKADCQAGRRCSRRRSSQLNGWVKKRGIRNSMLENHITA